MKFIRKMKKESGAYTVLTAIMLTLIVSCLALCIDAGYYYYRGAKLQNATDAAATAVACSLGSADINTAVYVEEEHAYLASDNQHEIAYKYLAKNGYGNRENLNVKVYMKGETLLETVDSEDYISAGFYKIVVESKDSTFFGGILDIQSLSMRKTAYAKADANYTRMPKALNYTVFGNSSNGTESNPTVAINGRTDGFLGGVANGATHYIQDAINDVNNYIVKPIQSLTINWNDPWWSGLPSIGFDTSQANSWTARMVTSQLTTNGDVHSNSNIESRIQGIQASRVQDADFTTALTPKQMNKIFGFTDIKDENPVAIDYGQVTFDAVGNINFYPPSGTQDTYYYVQNQQYIQETQFTIRAVEYMMKLKEAHEEHIVGTAASFNADYTYAAGKYLEDKIITQDMKDRIINEANSGNLTYDPATNKYTLRNQANIVYTVGHVQANRILDEVESEGMDRLLVGTSVNDEEGTVPYANSLKDVGNDKRYKDDSAANPIPYYAQRDSTNSGKVIGDEYDNLQAGAINQTLNFVEQDENVEGEYTTVSTIDVQGNLINRNYRYFSDKDSTPQTLLSQWIPYPISGSFNTPVDASTHMGANLAIASTFIEHSEYIDMPNLKPYFVRAINKSVRNATKVKEKINVSNAGQPTVRYAAKERKDTLEGYKNNLKYYDDKYKEEGAANINVTKANTYLFREFKDNANARVQNLSDDPITYERTSIDGLSYSVSISRYTYKGYNLYNGNALKAPGAFYTEKLTEREETKKDGKNAVKEYYDSTAKNDFNAVAAKKTSIQNEQGFNYNIKQNSVKNTINNVTKPEITQSAGSVEPKVTVTKPSLPDVFLGYGVTSSGTTIPRTSGKRLEFDNFVKSSPSLYQVTVSNDTYTAPAQPTLPTFPSISTSGMSNKGDFGGKNKNNPNDNYLLNNCYYSSTSVPWHANWLGVLNDGPWDYYVAENANCVVTGNMVVDGGKYVEVKSGATVKVGGNFQTNGGSANKLYVRQNSNAYIKGNFESKNDDTTTEVSGKMHVNGKIYDSGGKRMKLYVKSGGEVYTGGDYDMEKEADLIEIENGGKLHVGGKIYTNAESIKVNVNSGGKLFVDGNIEINDQKNELNVWGYCQINGDLKTVKNGTLSQNNRNYHVNVKSGGVLVVKGNVDFTHTDYLSVESGGTMIVQNQITVNNSGTVTVAGNLIQLNKSNTIDSSSITVNTGGKIYAVGSLNSKAVINVTSGSIYTLSNIYGNNDASGDNMLNISGTSNIYVTGVISNTKVNNQHIYIHDGTGTTLSVLGYGYSNCFDGHCNQIHAANSSSGNKIYLGHDTTIPDNNENIVNGSLSCYGTLTFNSNSQLTFTGTGTSIITGNLNATSASIMNVSNKQVLYVEGNINTTNITVDDAKVHANGRIDISQLMKLINGGLLEGVGGVSYASEDTAGGDFNSIKSINFTGNITANAMSEGYVKTGDVNATSMTLDNVKLKIDGNLTLSGKLELKNGSVLYVTKNISCGDIVLPGTKLYSDGNVTCSSVTQTGNSLFLIRKGSEISTSNYSSLTCSGKINLANTSKLYCEGNLQANAYDCAGSGRIYGYRLLNTTGNYKSDNNTGYIKVNGGSSADVFCGSNSAISNYSCFDITNGSLFYPSSSTKLNLEKLNVGTSGKVVIDGSLNNENVVVNSYAYIGSAGTYVNFGKTKVTNCRYTTEGQMYFVGGVDVTGADKTDMTGGNQQSAPDYFYIKRGSTSYIDPYNGNTEVTTLSLVSNYEAWGDTYFDCGLEVKGFMEDYKVPVIGTEKGGKDLYGTEGPRVGHLGMSMYIPKGVTYVNGSLKTYADNSKDSAIHIGNYDKTNNDAGLVVNGDINLASAIYNYGKFEIKGYFNINNSTPQKVTEKNDNKKYKEGKSILNGKTDGETVPVFFVGNYDNNGNIKNSNASVDLLGYVENYGSFYFNYKTVSIHGFNNEVSDIAGGDCAFINYCGSWAHFGGAVRLNSNQLYNKWKTSSRECIFTCDGKLTFGGCLYNLGTVVAKGDITNNEADGETDNSKTYLAANNYSVLNGFYKESNSEDVYNNLKNYLHPEATIFCGGKLELGASEQGGESGSVMSCGTMYVQSDFNIYTNGSRLSIKQAADVLNIFSNPNSHSFYRTALYLYDNSNTFVGGNFFSGAAMAIGKDTIFMCGGDLRSKRAIKLGETMGMVHYSVAAVVSRYALTFGDESKDSGVSYVSGKGATTDKYNSAYFYVGGNALVNTIGSGLKSWVGITGSTNVPLNNSRDMDIYPNTNIFIGGSLYANCKVYMKTNVDMIVAGTKTFYKDNGSIRGEIYTSRFTSPRNFAPENLTNGLAVENHLNANKNLKFYVYQSFDMSPNSSMIVNGAMQVNETSKIRDMTESYVYGSFTCGKYVELGKSENDMDFSGIVEFDGNGEHLAKDSNGNYKYLSNDELAYISSHSEAEFLSKYEFDKSAYMFVNGDFVSGQDLGTGALNLIDKIKKWLENTFLSTGYTKVYASSALKVNGNLTSSRYITLRHDAKVYCKGNMDAATSIEGGIYSEWYVGGHMEAATSSTTQILDTLIGSIPFINIEGRGKIEFFDQTRVIVGGNMFSSASIEIGDMMSNGYTRGRKKNYTVQAPEGSNSYYESTTDYEEALILTYENGQYKDKSGANVYLDGSTYKYSDLKSDDNKNIEYGSKDNVIVYVVEEGKYHSKTHDGDIIDYSDGAFDQASSDREPSTSMDLDSTDEPANYGAEVFCQGSMIAQNGHIKEYAYSCSVVGDYVYAPDYITLRSNADLWVLPEAFGNYCPHCNALLDDNEYVNKHCTDCNRDFDAPVGTYEYLPYPDEPEQQGGFLTRMINHIGYVIGKFGYETYQNFSLQSGSCYTFGNLTLNKNASLMGTNDLLQLGTITHADNSPLSGFETFLNNFMGFLTPRKVVLREDSLVLFGSNITIASSPVSLSIDALKGTESVCGFDSKGKATYPAYQYICTNHDRNGPHKGYNYTMTVNAAEHAAIQASSEKLYCDCEECHREIDKSKFRIVQMSHPAIMFAGNNLYIRTTVDMMMTYLIADQGNVYLNNEFTKVAQSEQNLKQLPNAVCSYNGHIEYSSPYAQISALFYAPLGNIDFRGGYLDIYGSVIGDKVKMNAFYQNFHRFNNWRTMDLHIAESGSVYLIPEQQYLDAEEIGAAFDLTSDSKYTNYGVKFFF